MLWHILLRMHVSFVVFVLVFQKISWEERLWNDLFCVGSDVKP